MELVWRHDGLPRVGMPTRLPGAPAPENTGVGIIGGAEAVMEFTAAPWSKPPSG